MSRFKFFAVYVSLSLSIVCSKASADKTRQMNFTLATKKWRLYLNQPARNSNGVGLSLLPVTLLAY